MPKQQAVLPQLRSAMSFAAAPAGIGSGGTHPIAPGVAAAAGSAVTTISGTSSTLRMPPITAVEGAAVGGSCSRYLQATTVPVAERMRKNPGRQKDYGWGARRMPPVTAVEGAAAGGSCSRHLQATTAQFQVFSA